VLQLDDTVAPSGASFSRHTVGACGGVRKARRIERRHRQARAPVTYELGDGDRDERSEAGYPLR
jgi:hypothetical protein